MNSISMDCCLMFFRYNTANDMLNSRPFMSSPANVTYFCPGLIIVSIYVVWSELGNTWLWISPLHSNGYDRYNALVNQHWSCVSEGIPKNRSIYEWQFHQILRKELLRMSTLSLRRPTLNPPAVHFLQNLLQVLVYSVIKLTFLRMRSVSKVV